jgi:hypothetical protein
VPIPFKGAYAPNVALVILTLFPQLINTAAYRTLAKAIALDLHVQPAQVLQFPLYNEAAFVFGILVGTSLMRRMNIRSVYLWMLTADIAVTLLVSFAASAIELLLLNVAAGLLAGMFLMVALPPLFTNFEAKYFPASAALMVPCLFGAATLAPIVCAPLAAALLWRPLFWGESFVLALALLLGALTVGPQDPKEPQSRPDWFALCTAAVSLACIFAGADLAARHEWTYAPALAAFVAGVAIFALLIVVEYRRNGPLLPIKQMLHAFTIIGFVAAAAGNAVYIADMEVYGIYANQVRHFQPMQIAAQTWPLFAMTVLTGVLFALVLRTRWVPVYALSGLIAICTGTGLLLGTMQNPSPAAQWASIVLIGYGAGSTITPGLFTVGLSVERNIIVKGIASVEVLRLTLGFISAPLVQHSDALHGMHWTLAYAIGFSGFAVIVTILLLMKYYRNPHAPNLERYVREGKPAFDSPAL